MFATCLQLKLVLWCLAKLGLFVAHETCRNYNAMGKILPERSVDSTDSEMLELTDVASQREAVRCDCRISPRFSILYMRSMLRTHKGPVRIFGQPNSLECRACANQVNHNYSASDVYSRVLNSRLDRKTDYLLTEVFHSFRSSSRLSIIFLIPSGAFWSFSYFF